MQKAMSDQIRELIKEGNQSQGSIEGKQWFGRVSAFLESAIGSDKALYFKSLSADDFPQVHALRLGYIEGLIAQAEAEQQTTSPGTTPAGVPAAYSTVIPVAISCKVFVVHGHDNEAKEGLARFLERIGLQPIILHEQASSGRTIIEKFETYSGDIAFAVVLLTPDDFGSSAGAFSDSKPRARQNVILELGYFMGRLGRGRVCALHKGGVELPSDYQGIAYVEMDSGGAWRTELARELKQAKLPIDLNKIL